MRLFFSTILLLSAASALAAPSAERHRLGSLEVAVASVRWVAPPATLPDEPHRLVVELSARPLKRDASEPLRSVVLEDVRGRRFDAETKTTPDELGPGGALVSFRVPDDLAPIALEVNGERFQVAHAGNVSDLPVVGMQ